MAVGAVHVLEKLTVLPDTELVKPAEHCAVAMPTQSNNSETVERKSFFIKI